MRFIYHHRTAGRGGEGLHISSVVNALRANGHDVQVVSPPAVDPMQRDAAVPLDKGNARTSGLERVWKWISRSCPQPVFELLEIGYNAFAFARLAPMLRGGSQVAYYERYAFLLVAGVWTAKLFGRPIILEVNEVAGVKRARAQTFVRLTKWIEQLTFSCADEIVTVSTFLQQEILKRGGKPGHVHVHPNAIDPARFDRPDRRDEVRGKHGLGDATVLGFVGWFDGWDRLERLVELVDQVRGEFPKVRLMLVGDGPVAAALAADVRSRGLEDYVVLTGPVARAEVPDYISAMDMCILPDSNEFGSPIVLFEFMVLGKPVVAPDVQPIRDVIEQGRTGFIVSRTDAADLRARVTSLLTDRAMAARMGQAARRRVLEHHTWRAVASSVEELAAAHLKEKAALDAAGVGAI